VVLIFLNEFPDELNIGPKFPCDFLDAEFFWDGFEDDFHDDRFSFLEFFLVRWLSR
jgi:hypothetical protein